MSLNRRERETTARELDNNLALTGLTRAQVRERTGLPPERFQAALEVNAVMDPADVWLVRDTIEDVIEPYLIQQGLLQRTPRGRMVTATTWEHFGLPVPTTQRGASETED